MLTLPDEIETLSCPPMTAQEMDATGAVWMMVPREAPCVGHASGQAANIVFGLPDDGDCVSIVGRAELVEDVERKKARWTVGARPWCSGPDDLDLLLLKLIASRIEYREGPTGVVSRTLAMADSVVAELEIAAGRQAGDQGVDEPIKVQGLTSVMTISSVARPDTQHSCFLKPQARGLPLTY